MPTVRESGAAIKYVTSSGFSLMTRIYVLGPGPVNRLLHRTHQVRTVPLLSCTRIKRPRVGVRIVCLFFQDLHELPINWPPTVVVRITLLQRLDTRPLNVAIPSSPLSRKLIFDTVPSNRIKKTFLLLALKVKERKKGGGERLLLLLLDILEEGDRTTTWNEKSEERI